MIHESQVSLYGPCFLSWPVGIHSQTNQKYYPVTLLHNNFKTTSQKTETLHCMLHVCTSSHSFSTSYRLPRVPWAPGQANQQTQQAPLLRQREQRSGDPANPPWAGSHAERKKTPGFVQKIWLHQTKLGFFIRWKRKNIDLYIYRIK